MGLIQAYKGDMGQYLSVTQYSAKLYPKFNKNSPNYEKNVKRSPGYLINKLLWTFNQSMMHTHDKISWQNFNILDKTTISQNINLNRIEICNLLWQIAINNEACENIIL